MGNNQHILIVGTTGFPYGFAAVQKITLIGQGLIADGCDVTILSYKGSHSKDLQFPVKGTFNGIKYEYTSGTVTKPTSFLERNWRKVVGRINEMRSIFKASRKPGFKGCFVYTTNFDSYILYWVYARLFGFKLVLGVDELNSSHSIRTSKSEKNNDYYFEKYAYKLSDGIMPISSYLMDHIHGITPKTPIQQLPIICDFSEFDIQVEKRAGIHFLYCGSPKYLRIIKFVIESFEKLDLSAGNIFLEFIVGGQMKDINNVLEEIANSPVKDKIRVDYNIPREDIPPRYVGASALLIPIEDTVQDYARFPHKIGEYLASGNPIISTNYGEMKNNKVFVDEESVLIASDYNTELFAEKMKFVIDEPLKAQEIGRKGRELGQQNFSYLVLGKEINTFFDNLNNNLD